MCFVHFRTFLLELLTQKKFRCIIQWTKPGEFKLIDPNAVAFQWSKRKNLPSIGHQSLTRALRNYYKIGIIAKVKSQYTYKYVCNLKLLVGYDACELFTMECGFTMKLNLSRLKKPTNASTRKQISTVQPSIAMLYAELKRLKNRITVLEMKLKHDS